MKPKISNKYIQLELPLFPKFKRNQKVKITGFDSSGEYNLCGKIGIIFSIGDDGIMVRFPGRYLVRRVPLILTYSVWEIEVVRRSKFNDSNR